MNLKKVKHDIKRLASLIDELTASKAIEGLVPDAFDNGKARVRFTSRFPHKERQDFTVTINDVHVFDAVKVPDPLWNDHVARRQQPTNNNES